MTVRFVGIAISALLLSAGAVCAQERHPEALGETPCEPGTPVEVCRARAEAFMSDEGRRRAAEEARRAEEAYLAELREEQAERERAAAQRELEATQARRLAEMEAQAARAQADRESRADVRILAVPTARIGSVVRDETDRPGLPESAPPPIARPSVDTRQCRVVSGLGARVLRFNPLFRRALEVGVRTDIYDDISLRECNGFKMLAVELVPGTAFRSEIGCDLIFSGFRHVQDEIGLIHVKFVTQEATINNDATSTGPFFEVSESELCSYIEQGHYQNHLFAIVEGNFR
jgi:hypothetical protein